VGGGEAGKNEKKSRKKGGHNSGMGDDIAKSSTLVKGTPFSFSRRVDALLCFSLSQKKEHFLRCFYHCKSKLQQRLCTLHTLYSTANFTLESFEQIGV